MKPNYHQEEEKNFQALREIVIELQTKKMATKTNLRPIVGKIFCAHAPIVFMVRNRPQCVNGGGFVATDGSQKVVFKVHGCETLGTKRAKCCSLFDARYVGFVSYIFD